MAKKKPARRKAAGRARKSPARRTARRTKASQPRKPAGKRATDRRRQAIATLRLRACTPGFTVNDVARSLAFYSGVLGFHVKERWVREGQLMGAELVAGGVNLYVGQDDWKKGRDRVKGVGFRIYCTTAGAVDELAARIQAHGVSLLEPLQDRPWGSRDFAIEDPDGFKITFSTELG